MYHVLIINIYSPASPETCPNSLNHEDEKEDEAGEDDEGETIFEAEGRHGACLSSGQLRTKVFYLTAVLSPLLSSPGLWSPSNRIQHIQRIQRIQYNNIITITRQWTIENTLSWSALTWRERAWLFFFYECYFITSLQKPCSFNQYRSSLYEAPLIVTIDVCFSISLQLHTRNEWQWMDNLLTLYILYSTNKDIDNTALTWRETGIDVNFYYEFPWLQENQKYFYIFIHCKYLCISSVKTCHSTLILCSVYDFKE